MFGLEILIGAVISGAAPGIAAWFRQKIINKQMLQVMDKSSPVNAHFQQKAFDLGFRGLGKHLQKNLK